MCIRDRDDLEEGAFVDNLGDDGPKHPVVEQSPNDDQDIQVGPYTTRETEDTSAPSTGSFEPPRTPNTSETGRSLATLLPKAGRDEPMRLEDISPVGGWKGMGGSHFSFLPGVRNVPSCYCAAPGAVNVVQNDRGCGRVDAPPEPNPRTSAK